MTQLGMVIVGIALAANVPAQEAKEKPVTEALQGTWVITTFNGQTPPEGAPELTLTFTGDTYHQSLGGQVNERGNFKVDAAKKPMAIDLIITEGGDAGKIQLGLVEVSSDTLRLSFDIPGGGQRPSDFTVKEGDIMVVAKKKKA